MQKWIFIVIMAFPFLPVLAQDADTRVGELINKSDWFSLEEEYPKLKNSVQTEFLKLLAEVMLDNNFNRPQQALENIGKLLADHQQEIGFNNVCNMVALATVIDGQTGNYSQAADNIKSFLDQLKAAGIKENLQSYEELYTTYNELREFSAPCISRPSKDVEVPISVEPVKFLKPLNGEESRGLQINVPVTIHGREYAFIFDTGAASTFMSERLAKEVGVQIFKDSLLINKGMKGEGYGMRGYLDSMQIGGITFKHSLITVAKPDATVDSIIRTDAVLGMDFMKLVQEIQIYPKEKKMVFPAQQTLLPMTGRNLLLTNDNEPILKAESKNERLLFFFDTGNSKADLFHTYYSKHQKEIDSEAVKDTLTGGGFGFIRTKEILLLPAVSFRIGDTFVELKDIRVHPVADNDQTLQDGNIGMDLIKLFSKITINLKEMFLELE